MFSKVFKILNIIGKLLWYPIKVILLFIVYLPLILSSFFVPMVVLMFSVIEIGYLFFYGGSYVFGGFLILIHIMPLAILYNMLVVICGDVLYPNPYFGDF